MPEVLHTLSLADFLKNHEAHLIQLKETRAPVALTVNGETDVVILDVESYHEMIDQLEEMKTVAAIRDGLAAAERGETKPSERVFAEMKARYGLSN